MSACANQKEFTLNLITKFLNDLANYRTSTVSMNVAAYQLRAILTEVEKI